MVIAMKEFVVIKTWKIRRIERTEEFNFAAARGRALLSAVRGGRAELAFGGGYSRAGGSRGRADAGGGAGGSRRSTGGAAGGATRGAAHRVAFRHRRTRQTAGAASRHCNRRGGRIR